MWCVPCSVVALLSPYSAGRPFLLKWRPSIRAQRASIHGLRKDVLQADLSEDCPNTHTADVLKKEQAAHHQVSVNGLPSSCQFQLYANFHTGSFAALISCLEYAMGYNYFTMPPQWLILGSMSGADWHQCVQIEFTTSRLQPWGHVDTDVHKAFLLSMLHDCKPSVTNRYH